MEKLEVLRLERRYGVASLGQVLVAVWEDESIPTLPMFRDLVTLMSTLRGGELARELITLCVVAERAEVPAPSLRRVAVEGLLLSDLFVVVHEGSGFRAAMVRAMFTTGTLSVRSKTNVQITADITQASTLVARCACSRPVDAALLASSVQALRLRMRAEPELLSSN